jgi:hypothetical protein
MNTGTVELKFQDGTAIKIKGSADFVAAVTTSIFEVGKGKSGGHIQAAEIKESSQAGKLVHSDSVENHEFEAPADHSLRRQSGWTNQKLCWSLKEAGERCGQLYHTVSGSVSRRPEDYQRLWTNDGIRIGVVTLRRQHGGILAEETKAVKRRTD